MENLRLLQLVESVLGKSTKKSRTNHAFHCPFCHHQKKKLEVDVTTNNSTYQYHWHCWVCDMRGRKITSLFRKLNVGPQKMSKLYDILEIAPRNQADLAIRGEAMVLPDEYKPLWIKPNHISPEFKNAALYVLNRGLTRQDILKYRIGYCESGEYARKIIIPSFDKDGGLNFFTGRSYYDEDFKHKNPDVSKDIIGFELYINWDLPIVLVEGGFDAIAIKRNAIPLFGKIVLDELKLKIVHKRVEKIYIALDKDALTKAITIVEYFMSHGVDVHLIELDDKDPSEIGFHKMSELIRDSESMTFSKIMEYKLFIL